MKRSADVIVIGGGGAGLSAAISAATSGATAIVVEKCSSAGGSTAMSVGSFTAANTSYQYRAGVNDSIEMFIEDMKAANGEFEGRENQELRQILAQNAGPTVEWISSLGVQFLGPTPEPPYEKPRMHNVLPNSTAYRDALLRECKRRGVVIHTEMRVDRLLRNREGEVIGARAGDHVFTGRRGVILATGDYSASEELKANHVGTDAARIPAINPNSTGDGIHLGLQEGGVAVQMDRLHEMLRFAPSRRRDPSRLIPATPLAAKATRWIIERLPKRIVTYAIRGALTSWIGPNVAMYHAGAILVGPDGKRISNEDSDSLIARAVAGSGSNVGYMVFDHRVAEMFSSWPSPVSTFPGVAYAYMQDYKGFRPDVYHQAPTIAQLAESVGVDPSQLEETVARWNRNLESGVDPDFGRTRFAHPIVRGPFYALGPMSAYVTLADGGLAVDAELRVVDGEGRPIPGLWAAGSTGQGGLQLRNHGLHIAWALVSGRLAGRHVARSTPREDLDDGR